MFLDIRRELKQINKEIKEAISFYEGLEKKEVSAKNILDWEGIYAEQEKWLEFIFNNPKASKETRVVNVFLVLGARSYGKTEVITKLGVIKELAKNPKLTFLLATRKEARAKRILKSLHKPMKELGFKGSYLSESINLDNNISKQDTYSICNGSESSLRGNHVDWLFGDDLVIGSDEHSEKERKNTIGFYQEALNVAKNIVILGQPVHEEDLYAMIENAFNTHLEGKEGNKSINIMIMKSPYGSIPERDKDLKSLSIAGVSERNIEKNYNLKLIKDETYPFANIEYEEFIFHSRTVACIDPSFEGEDATGIGIVLKREGKFLSLVKKIEGDIIENHNKILNFLEENNVEICFIELNNGGGEVYRKFKASNSEILFKGYRENRNKHVKILSHIGTRREKIILSTYGDFKEILNYNKSTKHDDVADALASLLNFVTGNKDKVKVV